uniref:Sodium/calcium exchanger membrane region domain-containing protein n=1 Tax=Panagrolaimus sp. JU765 TaxID=591449 RepID=A0AC34QH18_9BILA
MFVSAEQFFFNTKLHATVPYFDEAVTATANLPSDGECSPFERGNLTLSSCDYVKYFEEACEGGGYFFWTQYIICAESVAVEVFLIIMAVIILVLLLLAMSIAADDFFCPSISSIVHHLKISQSVAGVTFMAFGNGAPDIFSTIASVLNTKQPKAGLAIGDLLGGGAFVTSVVFSAIILVKPFKVDWRSTSRDIVFYLVGVGWMAFIMFYDSKLYIWQPAAYLALYLLYVSTVVFDGIYRKYSRKKERYHRRIERALSSHSRVSQLHSDDASLSSFPPPETGANGNALMPPRPSITSLFASVNNNESNVSSKGHSPSLSNKSQFSYSSPIPVMMEPIPNPGIPSNFVIPSIVISPADQIDGPVTAFNFRDGRFQYEERDIDYDSDDSDPSMVVLAPAPPGHSGRRYTIMSLNEARNSRTFSQIQLEPVAPIRAKLTPKAIIVDLLKILYPLDEDFKTTSRFSKVMQSVKSPIIVLFKLLIPHSELWCKTLSAIHCFTMPLTVFAAFQQLQFWVYSLPASFIALIALIFVTDYQKQPRFYKNITAYVGFCMSIACIYAISSEIINIITMISVLSRLSHEILGLTILAWSNSIGDLVADISVAKQNFSQMAASAAIGGPLFNLLVGFGASFFIATVTGKQVNLSIDSVKGLLLVLLGMSLATTQIILIFNKFTAKRLHAYILISLYTVLIIALILTDLKVINI